MRSPCHARVHTCRNVSLPGPADLNTPMAPELGLFLDECFFDAYNKQWGEMHSELKLSDYQADVDAFKVGPRGRPSCAGAVGRGREAVRGGARLALY